jgi:hypothetical protein
MYSAKANAGLKHKQEQCSFMQRQVGRDRIKQEQGGERGRSRHSAFATTLHGEEETKQKQEHRGRQLDRGSGAGAGGKGRSNGYPKPQAVTQATGSTGHARPSVYLQCRPWVCCQATPAGTLPLHPPTSHDPAQRSSIQNNMPRSARSPLWYTVVLGNAVNQTNHRSYQAGELLHSRAEGGSLYLHEWLALGDRSQELHLHSSNKCAQQ